MMPNHILSYSPLIGGIAIANPNNNGGETGTLGCIATRNGTDRWCISCYHVLCRMSGVMPPGIEEQIVLNFDPALPVIGESSAHFADEALDCAAARIRTIPTEGRIFGIGRLSQPTPPVVGMRVLKSGAATGITEGVVASISPGEVIIVAPSFPVNYALSKAGDSGAVWVDAASNSPVVLHRGDRNIGIPEAFGPAIVDVLGVLDLKVVVS